jgi:hypothetical protein
VASAEDEEHGESRGRGGDCSGKAKGWLLKKRCGEFIDDGVGPCAMLDRNAVGVIIAAAAATAAAVAAAPSPTAVAVVGGWRDEARSSIQSAKEARKGRKGRKRKRRKRRKGRERKR